MYASDDPRSEPLPDDPTKQHEHFVRDWVYGNHKGEFSPLLSASLHLGNKDRAWNDVDVFHPENFSEYLNYKWQTQKLPLDVDTLIAQGYVQEFKKDQYILTPHAHQTFAPEPSSYSISSAQDPRRIPLPHDYQQRILAFMCDWVYGIEKGEFSAVLKVTFETGSTISWTDMRNPECEARILSVFR